MQALLLLLILTLLSFTTQTPIAAAEKANYANEPVKQRVTHEGCPIYAGYSEDPYSPGYVAGTIPCAPVDRLAPENRERVLAVPPALTGHWVSEVDAHGNTHTYDIQAKFGEFVRNKAFEDWNNQCLQAVEYTHVTSGQRSGYESGMLLLDWKFGMNYTGENSYLDASGNPVKLAFSTSPNLSRHYAYIDTQMTKVVIVHPAESGLLPNILLADAAGHLSSVAGKTLLKRLEKLADTTTPYAFILEGINGAEMERDATTGAPVEGTELPIKRAEEMSYAIAIRGDTMYTYSHQLPGSDDGLISFKREAPQPVVPKVNAVDSTVASPCPYVSKQTWERKIWDNLITNMEGEWESEVGETLSVAMPPHYIRSDDAFYAHYFLNPPQSKSTVVHAIKRLGRYFVGPIFPGDLDIFTLCTHSRMKDFVKIWRNPISTDNLVVLNYKQSVNVVSPATNFQPGAGVHEEVGFFVFDWINKKVSRHGVLPHGSTFEMQSSFPTFSNQPLTDLRAPTLPRFGPSDKWIFRGVNSEEFLSGVQPGINGEAFQHGRPTVELNDPARLLNEINEETAQDFQGVTSINLHSGNSMDLPYVDNLAARKDPAFTKFVTNITSSFHLSEFGNQEPLLQYIQTVHFNFPVRGTPDIDRSQGRQSTRSTKWPHVIVSSLRRRSKLI